MCASPPLWFFFYHKWSVGTQEGCGCDPARPPACLKTSCLLKWDNAKERFYARVCTLGQHTHALIKANMSCGQTPTQKLLIARSDVGEMKLPPQTKQGKEEVEMFVLKITTDGPKISPFSLTRFNVPSRRRRRGRNVTRTSAPESPDVAR